MFYFLSASVEYITCMFSTYWYIVSHISQWCFVSTAPNTSASEVTLRKMEWQSVKKQTKARSVGKIVGMYCTFPLTEGHAHGIFLTPRRTLLLPSLRTIFVQMKIQGVIIRIFPIVLKAFLCMLFGSVKDCMFPESWLCIYCPAWWCTAM